MIKEVGFNCNTIKVLMLVLTGGCGLNRKIEVRVIKGGGFNCGTV